MVIVFMATVCHNPIKRTVVRDERTFHRQTAKTVYCPRPALSKRLPCFLLQRHLSRLANRRGVALTTEVIHPHRSALYGGLKCHKTLCNVVPRNVVPIYAFNRFISNPVANDSQLQQTQVKVPEKLFETIYFCSNHLVVSSNPKNSS